MKKSLSSGCSCLPACTEIDYEIELSMSDKKQTVEDLYIS